ncbi:hypothetical protein ACODT5_28600 [Streptomyces sp. 5.8]|uniref:zinc finger domain-containing protein n=1 Tax=Streptomyces sp. 5.8 TaxID=3406571 RepID=UPI003BB52A2C
MSKPRLRAPAPVVHEPGDPLGVDCPWCEARIDRPCRIRTNPAARIRTHQTRIDEATRRAASERPPA